jgi:putative PIN family toxin of toxin-antitoxin system
VRVFLDTNVLVSAILTRGLCRDLLRSALEDHNAVVSRLVVDELMHVLRDKLGISDSDLEMVLMTLESVEVVKDQGAVLEITGLDSNDEAILAAAHAAKADVFITGDQGILAESHRLPIDVVSPREFMELTSQADSYPIPTDRDDPTVSEPFTDSMGERAFEFALSVVVLCKTLEENQHHAVAHQLLSAGAGIGAGLEKAGGGESRSEFDRRMAIASDKARETRYWLRLLNQSGIVQGVNFETHLESCVELIRLLDAALVGELRRFEKGRG